MPEVTQWGYEVPGYYGICGDTCHACDSNGYIVAGDVLKLPLVYSRRADNTVFIFCNGHFNCFSGEPFSLISIDCTAEGVTVTPISYISATGNIAAAWILSAFTTSKTVTVTASISHFGVKTASNSIVVPAGTGLEVPDSETSKTETWNYYNGTTCFCGCMEDVEDTLIIPLYSVNNLDGSYTITSKANFDCPNGEPFSIITNTCSSNFPGVVIQELSITNGGNCGKMWKVSGLVALTMFTVSVSVSHFGTKSLSNTISINPEVPGVIQPPIVKPTHDEPINIPVIPTNPDSPAYVGYLISGYSIGGKYITKEI